MRIGDDPLALDDVQHLILLVNMGPGPCARAEGDVEQIKFATVRRADKRLESDLAVKVVGARWVVPGLCSVDSDNLHQYLLIEKNILRRCKVRYSQSRKCNFKQFRVHPYPASRPGSLQPW